MARRKLNGTGPVQAGAITVDAPGLTGELVVGRGGGAPTRDSRDELPPALRQAFRKTRLRKEYQARIQSPADTEEPATRELRRGGPAAPESIRIAVPPPDPRRGQVLLSRDEHGITTWHFPVEATRGEALGPPDSTVFEIPRYPAATEGSRAFGLPKIFQVLTYPIAKVSGAIIDYQVGKWDRRNHPTRLTAYGPDATQAPIDDQKWQELAKGPALLYVHGTFDTISGCFAMLPPATRRTLHDRYGKRVIAFDHATLADSPIANARALLETVRDRKLQVDIVCHSRGGLVARALSERPGDLAKLAPNFSVRTAVLVGATSNGTQLADVDRFKDMLDRMTTMLSFLPVPAAAPAIATITAIIRAIGTVGLQVAHDLDGLDAMSPDRPFLAEMNKAPKLAQGGSYRAILSDYEPDDPDLKAFFADEFKDVVVFKGSNDGMVSEDSIVGKTIKSPFPVTVTCQFGTDEHVEHANYFRQVKTSQSLLDWLPG
jgi:pimeloyl-ACP methyl ester carboxylesterase